MSGPPLPVWHPARLIASWFGSGQIPFAPGSWASLFALPFAWAISEAWGPIGLFVGACLAFLAGLWASSLLLRRSGMKDPRWIVIDEVAGQWLALVPVAPFDPILYGVGVFMFRLFDVLKPWPANWCDRRIPGAMGVMLDDVVAGIYAAAVVYAVDIANINYGIY
ncbi:MAG: phosphatidylglycerophosphatase A [Alphaproteobacteria bacterium]|nr:phosphatidylglycerophosphatase A [Alphaproteobacteria bacterium]